MSIDFEYYIVVLKECFSLSLFSTLILLSVVTLPAKVAAQSAVDQAQQQNENVIQQFEQRRDEEFRALEIEREKKALSTNIETQIGDLPLDGPCIDVQRVVLTGTTLFKSSTYKKVTGRYAERCLYIAEINALAEEISNLYIERGYITSRAYIPPQDLSNGILELQVIEGVLEKIKYETEQGPGNPLEIRAAFPNLEGSFFNLRDVEQGMDQMNRLASNNVRLELMPGENNGGSVVFIQNEKSKPWHVRTGVDNTGTESTGEVQGFVELDYDNILGVNDLLSFSFKHDLERANRRQSRSVSARYDVPYGPYNFNYSLSYFNYISEVSTLASDFKTSGFSRTHDLRVSRVLHRNQSGRTNGSLGLTLKENQNFLGGVRLESSSQKLTILKAGLLHSHQFPGAFIFGGINYEQGIGLLGAQEDTALGAGQPQAEFNRVSADFNAVKLWNMGFGLYNPRTDLTARAQWSRDELFSSEQISVGGPFSVRGFKEASLSGSTGAYARLDFSAPLPPLQDPKGQKYFGELRPFVGVDAGAVRSNNANPFEGGAVRSWSAGLKNQGGLVDFELAYSRPVSSPAFLDQESHDLSFRMSVKF